MQFKIGSKYLDTKYGEGKVFEFIKEDEGCFVFTSGNDTHRVTKAAMLICKSDFKEVL